MTPKTPDTKSSVVLLLVADPVVPLWQGELIRRIGDKGIDLSVASLDVCQLKFVTGWRDRVVEKALALVLDRRKVAYDAFQSIGIEAVYGKAIVPGLTQREQQQWPGRDIILNCVPCIDEVQLAQITNTTVWGVRFGDSSNIISPLAAAREVLDRAPMSYLKIVVAHPGEKELQVIYEAPCTTVGSSARANSSRLAWKAVECLPRMLVNENVEYVQAAGYSGQALQGCIRQSVLSLATALDIALRSLPVWLISRLGNKVNRALAKEQWILAIGFLLSPLQGAEKLKFIMPPKDRFWADPHLINYGGNVYVFFEELPYKTKKGLICCAPVYPDGSMGVVEPVLERDYHLSYPFIMEANGELYLIPETAENASIELYRCVQFPGKWEYVCDLMTGVTAYDTTLIHHQGLWWLFTTMTPVEGMSSWEQLHVFYAEKFPSDNWTPHPANPVVDDVRTARPAGKVFREGDTLFRPSQDSAGGYGAGVNIMEIKELNKNKYRESLAVKWSPDEYLKGARGMHTFNYVDGVVLLDFQVRRFFWQK